MYREAFRGIHVKVRIILIDVIGTDERDLEHVPKDTDEDDLFDDNDIVGVASDNKHVSKPLVIFHTLLYKVEGVETFHGLEGALCDVVFQGDLWCNR